MFRFSRSTLVLFAGLLIGIAGLVVQWIAEPAKFAMAMASFSISFPPGILFVVVAGLLTLFTSRWWWHPIFGVLIAFWIVGLGTLSNKLQPNLVSDNVGTVWGNIIMAVGLTLAMVAGVVSMVIAFRSRRRVPAAS